MTKVLDDAALERAFRAAERALAEGDPDTLAGRFSPRAPEPQPEVSAMFAKEKRGASSGERELL